MIGRPVIALYSIKNHDSIATSECTPVDTFSYISWKISRVEIFKG